MIQRLFWGFIGIALGVFMIAKNRQIVNFIGRNAWAEKNLGGTGTNRLYKIIAIVIILISFLYIWGILDKVIAAVLIYFGRSFGVIGN